MHKLYLLLAIAAEVTATTALKASGSFTRLLPSVVVLVGYGAAFYLLSRSLETISLSAAYAAWSGLGILLVAAAGAIFYKQSLDLAAVVGMALIVAGVLVLNLFSKSVVR